MRIFKNKAFKRWAEQIGLKDDALKTAVNEIAKGLYEANLGGNLFKKRVGVNGKGKRGGARTILVFKKEDKALFMYGFAKNTKANITELDEKLCKKVADIFLSWDAQAINSAIKNNEIIEVL